MAVKSVAVIGGGPSGIATLYELTHTLKDGTSIVGKDHSVHKDQLAFNEIVLFERNSSIGGTWAKTECGKINREPNLPDLSEENYDKPHGCFKRFAIPEQASSATFGDAYVNENADFQSIEYRQQWKSTGVYDGLFTNIPHTLMSYSFTEGLTLPKRMLRLLQPWEEVNAYLESVVYDNHLEEYIRFDSNVEKVYKKDDKWVVVVRLVEDNKEKWYQQEFDAIAVANGRSVPYIPVIENLKEFYEKNPKIVQHCKNISQPHKLNQKKKLLFVGSGISTVDLIQYCFPREEDTIFISRRSAVGDFDWVNHASYSAGLVSKPEIKRFIPETNSVEFLDGSIESDFDAVIFGTGYHRYFPFLEDFEAEKGKNYHDLFLHVFSKEDPTLAVVGTLYAPFFFTRAEASAAAICGVWSGARELPSKEEQQKSVAREKYAAWDMKKDFIDHLIDNYGTVGRPRPFDSHPRKDPIRDYGEGFRVVGQIFSDLKEGRITHEDVFTILE